MPAKLYLMLLHHSNLSEILKISIILNLIIFVFADVRSQNLMEERVIFANEKIERIEYLGPDFFAVATYNTTVCGSNSLSFIKNGKIISRYNLAEKFIKEIKVRKDSIVVSIIMMYSDVGSLVGGGLYYFDMEGKYLSQEIGGFYNNSWRHYDELIVVDNGNKLLLADSTGQIYHHIIGSEQLTPVSSPLPDQPSRPISLMKENNTVPFSGEQIIYIFAYNDLLLSGDVRSLNGEELFYKKQLDNIQFVKHYGYDRIMVIYDQQISILGFSLRDIRSNQLNTNAEHWSYEGHYLFGINDLGISAQDSSLRMLEVFRIQISDLTEISRDTIFHNLLDIKFKGYQNSLFLFGLSPDGQQGVLQTYDLRHPPINNTANADISINMKIIDHQLIAAPWNYSLRVDAEISVSNKMPENVDNVLLTYYEHWPQFCGSWQRIDEKISISEDETRIIHLALNAYDFRITNGGDSMLFSIPCVSVFPFLMPYDINTIDNTACTSIKVKRPTTSTNESSADKAKWKIYPNPTQDVLYLNTEGLPVQSIRFSLWNAQGQSIRAWQSSTPMTEISLNSMNIPAGVYWISAMDNTDGKSLGTQIFIKR